MGSFNGGCSLSHLCVEFGDLCYLLILKPYQYKEDRIGSMYVDYNEQYKLFCLPIIGTYDDYGRIEDIVRDDNVEYLEKRLGITIEQLVNIACCDRDAYDRYGALFETFFINPDLLEYDVSLESLLKGINFTKQDNEVFVYNKNTDFLSITVTIIKDEDNKETEYIATVTGTKFHNKEIVVQEKYDDNEDFLKNFAKNTGIYMGMKNMETFNQVKDICSCFVLKEIVDNLISNGDIFNEDKIGNGEYTTMTPGMALELGFSMDSKNMNIFSVKKNKKEYVLDFTDYYIKLNGEEFNYVSQFLKKTKGKFKEEFENLKSKSYFDFSGVEIGLGGKFKFDEENILNGFFFSNTYERIWQTSLFDRNIPMMNIYMKAFNDWKFTDLYTTTQKIMVLFDRTHNMLAPTCAASQNDYRETTVTLNEEVRKWVEKEKKKYDDEEEDYE